MFVPYASSLRDSNDAVGNRHSFDDCARIFVRATSTAFVAHCMDSVGRFTGPWNALQGSIRCPACECSSLCVSDPGESCSLYPPGPTKYNRPLKQSIIARSLLKERCPSSAGVVD